MWKRLWDESCREARTAAIDACWSQWRALEAPIGGSGKGARRSVIDVEALLVMSWEAQGYERRLSDVMAWWAETGADLTSVPRLKALTGEWPSEQGRAALGGFAALAAAAGSRRWSRHAEWHRIHAVRESRFTRPSKLVSPAAMWVRLRAGLGVGAKADVLAHLLGLQGARASTREVAEALGYSTVAVRSAAEEMAWARFIRRIDGRPVTYRVPAEPWAQVLELDPEAGAENGSGGPELPAWRDWSRIFAFLSEVCALGERVRRHADEKAGAPVVEAWELAQRYAPVFERHGVPAPPMDRYRGVDAPHGLAATVRAVAGWIADVL